MNIKKIVVYLGVLILFLLSFLVVYFINKSERNKVIIIKSDTKNITTEITGRPGVVLFTPCKDLDPSVCFGSGSRSLGEKNGVFLWDMISTETKLYFGIKYKSDNSLTYIAEIDFKDYVYSVEDYNYFKDELQDLFLENKKVIR